MRGSIFASPILRRIAVAWCAVSLVSVSQASGGAASPLPRRDPTINTWPAWQGGVVTSFGCPHTSTYGQVITVPEGMTRLTRFNFYQSDSGLPGSLIMRGEVYAWDGSKATGTPLWESRPRPVDYADEDFHRKQFRPHGVDDLEPGAQYVIFASVSKDWERCDDYGLSWEYVHNHEYRPGTFVYLNDAGDASQWTSSAWGTSGIDLAFKAWLS
jgi:hypothetical protein